MKIFKKYSMVFSWLCVVITKNEPSKEILGYLCKWIIVFNMSNNPYNAKTHNIELNIKLDTLKAPLKSQIFYILYVKNNESVKGIMLYNNKYYNYITKVKMIELYVKNNV